MIYSDSAEGYKVRNVGRVDLAPEVVVLCTEVHLLFFLSCLFNFEHFLSNGRIHRSDSLCPPRETCCYF